MARKLHLLETKMCSQGPQVGHPRAEAEVTQRYSARFALLNAVPRDSRILFTFSRFAMTAMRFLICWVYANTGSLLLAQRLHASSTVALAVLGPFQGTLRQEATWYTIYALVLWIVVAVITKRVGSSLV